MKALVRVPGGVAVTDQPEPSASADEVILAVHSCGICGSDVHAAEAGARWNSGIPGHEFSGTIAAVGSNVTGWRPGQAVAVNPLGACGTCDVCLLEMPILCRQRPNLGLNAPGGFAEFVAVHHRQLHALPAGLPVELGSRVEPLAVSWRAVVEAAPRGGDNAVVFGVGPIGSTVILALRAVGAGTIVAVGRSSAGRRAAAAKLGADVVLDSREVDVADYVQQTGLEIAHAFECSGDPRALLDLGRLLRPGGNLIGLALGREPANIDLRLVVGRGLRLIGSCAYAERDFVRAVELITSETVDVRPLISARIALDQAPDAFVRLRHPGDLVSVLVQPIQGGE